MLDSAGGEGGGPYFQIGWRVGLSPRARHRSLSSPGKPLAFLESL